MIDKYYVAKSNECKIFVKLRQATKLSIDTIFSHQMFICIVLKKHEASTKA